MSNDLNQTPSANRIHIGFFGRRNAGKSSVVNAFTSQDLSIVSDIKGTTTDPVSKAMELLPLGPVLIIDTPGIDDIGELGAKRIKKTKQILNKTDIAIVIIDTNIGKTKIDEDLIALIKEKSIPYIIVYNKRDLKKIKNLSDNEINVCATQNIGINELKEKIASITKNKTELFIISDKIQKNDIIVLVTPIDSAAPKGRIILPQVQTLRDILDKNAICLVTQTNQLTSALASLSVPPKIVITDSKDFNIVAKLVPESIPLTSFSILFARLKGVLKTAVHGAFTLDYLQNGNTILICEGCTHHRQCDDIGTVLLPKLIKNHTKKELNFEFTSGGEFPEDISEFALVVHCGGCMLNEQEIKYRQNRCEQKNIPFTNYGIVLAHINGILKRSIALFPDILDEAN